MGSFLLQCSIQPDWEKTNIYPPAPTFLASVREIGEREPDYPVFSHSEFNLPLDIHVTASLYERKKEEGKKRKKNEQEKEERKESTVQNVYSRLYSPIELIFTKHIAVHFYTSYTSLFHEQIKFKLHKMENEISKSLLDQHQSKNGLYFVDTWTIISARF